MNSAGTGWIPVTPTVLCAVSAVIAVMPCTPQRANAFRSAWMPAPPPESEPAIESTAGRGHRAQVRRSYGPRSKRAVFGVLSGFAPMASTPRGRPARRLPGERGRLRRGFAADGTPPAARAGLEAVARAEPAGLPGASAAVAQARGRALLVGRGRPRVLRGPGPAGDHRRRLGARQARPGAARARAERVRRRRLRRRSGSSPRASSRRGRPLRRLLRAGDARDRAAGRHLDRRRRPGPRARPRRRVARARGQRAHAERASPTCTRRGARCSSTSTSRPTRRRGRWTARSTCWPTRCAPSPPRARAAAARRTPRVLTDGEHNSAYWEHAWLSRQLGIPLVEPRELELRATAPVAAPARPARGAPDRRHLPPHQRRPPGLRHRPAADRAGPARPARASSTSTAPASPTTSSPTPTSRT